MSLFLSPSNEAPTDPLLLTFFNIHCQMITELQATDLQINNELHYQTFLQIPFGKIEIQWRFQPAKSNNMKVHMRPNLSDGNGDSFRVEAQRGFVDLLRIISRCNRDKNKTMSFVISEYNFIQICTIFPLQFLKDVKLLRKAIKVTNSQLPSAIERLLLVLKPFLQPRNRPPTEESMSNTAKLFLDRSYKLLLLTKFNQLKNQDQLKRLSQNSSNEVPKEDLQRKIENYRSEALRKMKDCFKVLGVQDTFLKNSTSFSLPAYSEWIHRINKQASYNLNIEQKNVLSVKILKETCKPVEKDCEGSHCKIILCRFKLSIKFSVNSEVNLKFDEQKPLETVKEIELEIVKKVVKNVSKSQSKNSFQNELNFILYIKERCCRYVSTYYWDTQRGKDEMTIMMDHYPHNLRQLLQSQGKLLSFRQKLSIIYKITSGVNWLASNYVCHRDIKPENIMISQHRIPKIVDFGSCCPVNGVGNSHFHVKESRLLGTPSYYHPYNDSMNYDYRKNEYEQHLLFDAYSLGQVMRDVFDDGLPNLLPNLQGLMKYIIERCEEQDPANRLTYQEMLYLFQNFLENLQWLQRSFQ